jgi:hypothetical protein
MEEVYSRVAIEIGYWGPAAQSALVSSLLVPGGGLEPPRPCGLRILSPLRLPISPSGQ